MIELIVLDLDGTLLDSNHIISKKNLDAIRQAEQLGSVVTLATGRPVDLIKVYLEQLQLNVPIITCNGARILNPSNMVDMYNAYLSSYIVRDLVTYCQSENHDWLAYCQMGVLTTLTAVTEPYMRRNDTLPEHLHAAFHYIDHASEITDWFKVNKFLIIQSDHDRCQRAYQYVRALDNLSCAQSQPNYIDIMPEGINKALGLTKLLEHLNITSDQVAAFGDQGNDLDILSMVKYPITLDNGIDKLKEIAVYVGPDHNQSGVAVGINWLVKGGHMTSKFELTEDFIRFEKRCHDWRDAIIKSSDILIEKGYIEKTYQDAMLSSVDEHGPYIVIAPHIAMPHARPETGSNKVGFSVLQLEEPVSFSEEEMHQVKLLIALSCKDSDTHIEILQKLVIILSNEAQCSVLMTSKDKGAIVNIFKEAFNE